MIAAARKYNKVVQMGAQRRSAPILTAGIKKLHEGIIGRVYMAKTWYTNNRKATHLKSGAVPWIGLDLTSTAGWAAAPVAAPTAIRAARNRLLIVGSMRAGEQATG